MFTNFLTDLFSNTSSMGRDFFISLRLIWELPGLVFYNTNAAYTPATFMTYMSSVHLTWSNVIPLLGVCVATIEAALFMALYFYFKIMYTSYFDKKIKP